jgi:hypothetical protein
MPILNDYHHFGGRHWESGSLHNYYAYRNVLAPHTGEPYSEALFMGVAGGAAIGYFSFAYDGYDPHVALLTRNTFDPLNTALTRLGVVQEVMQTNRADKGLTNLLDTLAEGLPAIVWADMWSLPYNAFAYDEGMWGMMPVIVYGYDETADIVQIADRAQVGLTITTAALAAARARVKKDKFRVMTLDQPDPEKLAAAVTAGIWDCINLYLEKPPKGSANSWGIKALHYWADLLTKPKQRMSWAKEFPAGPKFYAGLLTAFNHYGVTGIRDDADRECYATFLAEAALIVKKPALQQVADAFRQSSTAWRKLATILLPDAIAPFGESRRLLQHKDELFRTQGDAALPEIRQINEQLQAIRATMTTNFPLAAEEVTTHCAAIADQVRQIATIELDAVSMLRDVMAT